MQQDAQEFLNYLLNTVAETVEKEEKKEKEAKDDASVKSKEEAGASAGASLRRRHRTRLAGAQSSRKHARCAHLHPAASEESTTHEPRTWVHDIFEGVLTNEMRCLTCETVCADAEEPGRLESGLKSTIANQLHPLSQGALKRRALFGPQPRHCAEQLHQPLPAQLFVDGNAFGRLQVLLRDVLLGARSAEAVRAGLAERAGCCQCGRLNDASLLTRFALPCVLCLTPACASSSCRMCWRYI